MCPGALGTNPLHAKMCAEMRMIMTKWSRMKFAPNLPLGENGERVTGCKEHIELSKNAAKEGMVLLKNENNVLPLKRGTKVALFGKGTFDYVKAVAEAEM